MDKQFNVKDVLLLMVLTIVVLLLLGCGGSDEGDSPSSSNPPSSGSTRPAPDQGATAQLERLTLTAYPIKTKGTSELTLLTGGEQSFLAVGEYSNGQSRVLTEELTVEDWLSSDTELGEFVQSGVLKGKAPGAITVAFSQGNLTSNSLQVTVTDATITDITITPSVVSVAKGHHQPLTATATYSNGLSMNISDSVTWVSDDPSKATITSQTDHGLLNGVSIGSTTVTAIKEGITSQSVNVDVSDAVITGITVTPSIVNIAKGQHQTLAANAVYSDGTSSIISNSVTWRPVDTNTATITSNGVLSGDDIGTTTLTATKDGITSLPVGVVVSEAELVSISVTPPMLTVAKGQHQALTATAIYSDNTSSDISNYVTWKTIEPSTATVVPGGKVTGVNVGSTSLTAVKNGITSNSVSVDVSNAVVTGISVTPSVVSIAKGQTQTLTANAIYSDNTSSDISDSVTWIPSDTSIAVVTENGVLSGSNVGATSLTALKDGITSHSVSVEVSDAVLTSIDVTPSVVNVAKGQDQTLTATATYSDNTFSDVSESVTWFPIDTSIAAVTAKGVLSGSNIGTTTLTAVKGSITSQPVDVTISDAVLTDISVTPSELTVAKGHSQPLVATATYSDNTSSDISDSVTWIPVDTTTATVTPQGQVTGVSVGTTTVTAVKDNITSNMIDVDTTNAVMTGLTLTPPAVGLMINAIQQMKATATYSDGTSSDVTDSITWWGPVGGNEMSLTHDGLVKGLNQGSTGIKATYNGFSAEVAVNVCNRDSDGLKGKCIDVYDKGNGHLFTSTPSIAYLDSIGLGGSSHTSSTDGMFYTFKWAKADALCPKYNAINLAGRSNWRLPTLRELRNMYMNMYPMRSWSENTYYWTSTVMNNGNGGYWGAYKYYNLSGAFLGHHFSFFASCFSEP